MTRNIAVVIALDGFDDATASTDEIALKTSLPDRTVRRAMRSLIAQRLVWSPVRGLWQLTPAGGAIAASLRQGAAARTGHPPSDSTLLEALWSEGLSALWRK